MPSGSTERGSSRGRSIWNCLLLKECVRLRPAQGLVEKAPWHPLRVGCRWRVSGCKAKLEMPLMKYNPRFLPDQALIDSFCVRRVELESLLETLRETKGDSNVHRLVIGPRGSGKTTLVLRVAAEIRRDPSLSAMFFPLVLPEEHYEVSNCGEFWLECVSRLAASAPPESNGIDLRLTHEELRGVGVGQGTGGSMSGYASGLRATRRQAPSSSRREPKHALPRYVRP